MTYIGMNKDDGRELDDLPQILQSVRDILTTPLGSRVMRRSYGSLVPDLIDAPTNSFTRMQLMAATVIAITRWEPRLNITSIDYQIGTGNATGSVVAAIEADRVDGSRSSSPVSARVTVGRGAL